jgi:hypothetical protein
MPDTEVMAPTVLHRVDEQWTDSLVGPDETVRFPNIDVALPGAELYEGLTMPVPAAQNQ